MDMRVEWGGRRVLRKGYERVPAFVVLLLASLGFELSTLCLTPFLLSAADGLLV